MYGIFTYIWLLFLINVGKYSSPMDGMGYMQCALEPRHGHESRVGGGDGRRQLGCITVTPVFLPFTGSWISDMTYSYYYYCFGVFQTLSPHCFFFQILEQLKRCCFLHSEVKTLATFRLMFLGFGIEFVVSRSQGRRNPRWPGDHLDLVGHFKRKFHIPSINFQRIYLFSGW